MKTIAILIAAALAFAAVVVGALLCVLAHINEERRPRCERCAFFDGSMCCCWITGAHVQRNDEPCKEYQEKED